jgi:general secretion pathway protein K
VRGGAFGSTRGIALISVLWIAGLLAVMAASFVSANRTEARLARNQLENAKAQALADAGAQRAALGLLDLDAERVWRADGRIYGFTLGEGEVQVSIRDEDGKIDLNEGPLELLAGLFTALDLEPEAAQALAERIGDFRDPDHDALPLGAEDPAYLAAGLAAGAADRPFVSEAELVRVLGMSEELYRRIRHVTVHAAADGLDPDQDPLAAIDDDEVLAQIDLYWLPSRDAVFTVRAEAWTSGGGRFVREAVIELDGSPQCPFLVHAWRQESDS